MESIFNLVLDLQKPVSSIEVPVKIGESGRVLKIKIIDGKRDIELPNDLQMTIGDEKFTDISLENPNFYIENNYIIYHIAAPFIQTVGSRILELNLISENKSVRTMTFRLNVFKKLEAPIEEILPNVELSQLEQLIQMLQTFTQFGEIITNIEFNENNELVITSETTSGEEHTYTSESLKGEQGIQGIQGIPGPAGDSITEIQKTSTSGLIDTYTVTLNTGATYEFTVTNGAQGETGPRGATGATGVGISQITKSGTSNLVDTYTIILSNGNTYDFTVTNGKVGSDGASAYEVAIENGYEGTVEEWLLSLKGEKGETGDTGPQGHQGVGITNIQKTGTSGLIDTYTITYSDNTTSTFTVRNGADGTPAIPPALVFDKTSPNSAAMSAIADYVAEQIGDIVIPSTAADVGAIDSSEKGAANGVAQLDNNGKVPSTQLPSYVDDIIEGYYYNGNFYDSDPNQTVSANLIIGETGKIYVDLNTNRNYRWGGSAFIEVSPTEIPIASTQVLGGVKVGNNLNIDQNGVLSADEQISSAERNAWDGAIPTSGTLTLLATTGSWVDEQDGTYTQQISITGGTANTKVDLQVSVSVIEQMQADKITALYVLNDDGVFYAVAVGNAPTDTIIVQYTRTEVVAS